MFIIYSIHKYRAGHVLTGFEGGYILCFFQRGVEHNGGLTLFGNFIKEGTVTFSGTFLVIRLLRMFYDLSLTFFNCVLLK